ncbi:MAG: endonuclease/exonuclease/phosphatase family protein [Treponema sp.]|jgi:endonuclease/exonuclease/phosphatase family metal-dependent hydrolase|nr:endonuclease/exonuclease/phosphatase family protein [Treponema sp.]
MLKKSIPFILLLIVLFCSAECEGLLLPGNTKSLPKKIEQFTAVVWNVQTFFDGQDTGNEYAEFRESAGWTQEKYEARLLAIGQAILRMRSLSAQENENQQAAVAPDLIGLVELENANTLEDLLHGPLSKQGYVHTFFGNLPGMSLGIGVLSRFPLTETKIHSITVNNQTAPRPVLEVHLEPGGEPLIFFICHWKSKVGGDDATEPLRRASAMVISRRLLELREEKPGAPVIIMGDLNENHDEFYRRQGTVLSALLPDDEDAALLAATQEGGFLVLSKEKPPRAEYFDSSFVLYTPWENELLDGSYYYRDNWETIDHFLLSEELFDNRGWDYDTCMVLNMPPFTNAKALPNPYNPRNGFGLSDHLPLILFLKAVTEIY